MPEKNQDYMTAYALRGFLGRRFLYDAVFDEPRPEQVLRKIKEMILNAAPLPTQRVRHGERALFASLWGNQWYLAAMK